MTATTRKRLRIAVVGGLLAVGALFLLSGRDGRSAPDTDGAARPPPRGIALPRPNAVRAPVAATDEMQRTLFAAEGVRETRAKYLEGSIYPPWSQPASPAWGPFMNWNGVREHVDDTLAEDPEGRVVQAALALDKLYARPGEALVATLTLWRGDRSDPQTRIDFEADARVQIFDPSTFEEQSKDPHNLTPGYLSVGDLPLEPVPGKPNLRRGKFVPSDNPALADTVASVRVIATVRVKGKRGATFKPLILDFTYTPEEPVEIISKTGDRIDEQGALVVDFEVDVKKVAPTKVESTLYAADGTTPIAVFQDFWRPTATGRQSASVRFFGRIIAERGIPGPYTLSLHGYAMFFDQQPAEVHWRDDRVFTTSAYGADRFSLSEWDDPLKDDMLRTYDSLEEGFASGRL